jgi:hypothetical protein
MSSATISPCGLYRYTLHRRIPSALRWIRPCLFVMLNPSTADASQDDPTIRRCLGFAKREGCTGLTVVNLFALRATDPAELAKHDDPFGPDNHLHLRAQFDAHRTGIIVAAWGAHPMAHDLGNAEVFSELCSLGALCLGMTKHGSPRHPLYVKSDQPLVPWKGTVPP